MAKVTIRMEILKDGIDGVRDPQTRSVPDREIEQSKVKSID
jgi:hypothetical protein